MIIVLKPNCTKEQLVHFTEALKRDYDVSVNTWVGTQSTVLGLIGDTTAIDIDYISAQDFVESVKRVQEPYKKANRKFHPGDTVITLPGGQKIGGGGLSIQGLKAEGIELLQEARAKTGLPIVTEIMSINHLPLFEDVDIIQVGARNMQNFELLKALGKINKPILLKRGLSSTIEELLMSAEYIMAGGNEQVILCERGIRTYETYTRNTLDISAVPILKRLSHLPVVVDPSHASGIAWLVEPLALAAVAAGADGLIIEVHNNPAKALSDGAQSLTPDQFDHTAAKIFAAAKAFGKQVD